MGKPSKQAPLTFKEKAKSLFLEHKGVKQVFFASDGMPFFSKEEAAAQAEMLKDKTITTIKR